MIHLKQPLKSGIQMHYLNTLTGHSEVSIDDSNPEKRAELASHVNELIRKGFTVIVQKGDETFKIKGYDAEENEWIVVKQKKTKDKPEKRVKAEGSTATTIPQRTGG